MVQDSRGGQPQTHDPLTFTMNPLERVGRPPVRECWDFVESPANLSFCRRPYDL